jgi:hypothetical protein
LLASLYELVLLLAQFLFRHPEFFHSVLQFLEGDRLGILRVSNTLLQDGKFVAQLRLSLGSVFHPHLQHGFGLVGNPDLALRIDVARLTQYRK